MTVFTDFSQDLTLDKSKAASHKVDLTLTGYNDAFIVAFKMVKELL